MDPADAYAVANIFSSPEAHKSFQILIEKISNVVGELSLPWREVRRARTYVLTETIKAEGDQKVALIRDDTQAKLAERTLERMLSMETRRQVNFEKIVAGAAPEMSADSKSDQLDEDWIHSFFEDASKVSNAHMQRLWSKLLAGEANAPGAFGRRSLNLLSTMNKRDADLFGKLCCFCTGDGKRLNPLFIDMDLDSAPYFREGIGWNELTHLAAIGIIDLVQTGSRILLELPPAIQEHYFDRGFGIILDPAEPGQLDLGKASFTAAGLELSAIVDRRPIDGMFDHIVRVYRSREYQVILER